MKVESESEKSAARTTPQADLGFALPEPARLSRSVVVGVVGVLAVGLSATFFGIYLPRRNAAQVLEREAAAAAGKHPTYVVIAPKLISNERTLKLPASVQPLEEAVVYARANGYVRRWLVDLGERVKEGQLLAEIDTPELDQELSQARAALAKAQASKVQAEAGRDFARRKLDRTGKLVEAGVAAEQDLDDTRARSDVGEAEVNVAHAAAEAEQANIRRLRDLKEFARVTAPFAGTITSRSIDRGSLVTAGNATPLFKIAATDTVRVYVQVPQDVASSVRVGASADVSVRELAGSVLEGHIAHTAGVLDSVTRTLNTEIRVDNKEGKLLSGMYAEVVLKLPSLRKVYELPATALLSDAQGLRVAAVQSDDTLKLQPIGIERDLGATLHVASGLSGDERIVQIASADMTEGQRITPVQPKPVASAAR